MRRILLSAALVLMGAAAVASPLGLGYQKENWSDFDLDISTNPKYLPNREPGFAHLQFSIPDVTTWVLEEPGVIFGGLSGMMETEANRVNARDEAIRKGNLTYSYEYGKPAPIPSGRWFRWAYASGQGKGAFISVTRTPSPLAGGSMGYYDPNITFDMLRLNMDIITAPIQIGESGFYWMPSGDIAMTSMKIYGYTPGASFSTGRVAGTDFSTITAPINLHLGWQPRFLPWLTVEAKAGWDFIAWGLFAIAAYEGGLQNYTQGYNYGGKAQLGVDWFQIYYQYSRRVEPLWNFGGYARRYEGTVSSFGARLDLGNLLARMIGD